MNFNLEASLRSDMGKGASRRLRREAKIPAVVYGGEDGPVSIEMSHDLMLHSLEHEAFYSRILSLKIDGKDQKVILKDLQRHPYKPKILHADFLRISKNQPIRVHVPIHLIGADDAKGVKQESGILSHIENQVELECLPADLPEFIEIDVTELALNESVHLSQLKLPKGTQSVALMAETPTDLAVVSIHLPKKVLEPEAPAAEEAEEVSDANKADEADNGKDNA